MTEKRPYGGHYQLMSIRNIALLILIILQLLWAGCAHLPDQPVQKTGPVHTLTPEPTWTEGLLERGSDETASAPSSTAPFPDSPTPRYTETPFPTLTETLEPSLTPFAVGEELTIRYLREWEIMGSEITFHERLANGPGYRRHLVSYQSEDNQIYGLLTVPFKEPPEDGFKAVVFNHGYIPPTEYRTTARYEAYVNYLARSGLVVFKIDYRGHGRSEGQPSGSYFSPGYTIDAVAALKSLQTLDYVDPDGIGMWGHSMAGNLVLRAMLIEPEIQAGVIWAGAVYSYEDFAELGISDFSYRPPPTPDGGGEDYRRRSREIIETHGRPDLNSAYWREVALTEHLEHLTSPLQIHHAENDPVVSIAYSERLAAALQEQGKPYQFFRYEGGEHNLVSPYFDQAMLRTVEFFRENL